MELISYVDIMGENAHKRNIPYTGKKENNLRERETNKNEEKNLLFRVKMIKNQGIWKIKETIGHRFSSIFQFVLRIHQ